MLTRRDLFKRLAGAFLAAKAVPLAMQPHNFEVSFDCRGLPPLEFTEAELSSVAQALADRIDRDILNTYLKVGDTFTFERETFVVTETSDQPKGDV